MALRSADTMKMSGGVGVELEDVEVFKGTLLYETATIENYQYFVNFTRDENGTYGSIDTPGGKYYLEARGGRGWIVSAETLKEEFFSQPHVE